MKEYTDEDTGEKYVSSTLFSHGDYAGSETVGRANIRALQDSPGAWLQHLDYGYEQLWLPDTPENRELIEGLEDDYPLIDDEVLSQIELELEEEAWGSWIRRDLLHNLPDSIQDFAEDIDDGVLYECYRQAMEKENEYPTFEGDGVYVHIDRIQDTFNLLVESYLPPAAEAILELEEEGWDICDKDAMYVAQDWLQERGY